MASDHRTNAPSTPPPIQFQNQVAPHYQPSHLVYDALTKRVQQLSPTNTTLVSEVYTQDDSIHTNSIFNHRPRPAQNIFEHTHPILEHRQSHALTASRNALRALRASNATLTSSQNVLNRSQNVARDALLQSSMGVYARDMSSAADKKLYQSSRSINQHQQPSHAIHQRQTESIDARASLGRHDNTHASHRTSVGGSYGPAYRLAYKPSHAASTAKFGNPSFAPHTSTLPQYQTMLHRPWLASPQTLRTLGAKPRHFMFMFLDPQIHAQFPSIRDNIKREILTGSNSHLSRNVLAQRDNIDMRHSFYVWLLDTEDLFTRTTNTQPNPATLSPSSSSTMALNLPTLKRNLAAYVALLDFYGPAVNVEDMLSHVTRRFASIVRDQNIPLGSQAFGQGMTRPDMAHFLNTIFNAIIFHVESGQTWQVAFYHTHPNISLSSDTSRGIVVRGLENPATMGHAIDKLQLSMIATLVDRGKPQWILPMLNRAWYSLTTQTHRDHVIEMTIPAVMQQLHTSDVETALRGLSLSSLWRDGSWNAVRDWHIRDKTQSRKFQQLSAQEHHQYHYNATNIRDLTWRAFKCTWIGVRYRSSTSAYYDQKVTGMSARQRAALTASCNGFDLRQCLFDQEVEKSPPYTNSSSRSSNTSAARRSSTSVVVAGQGHAPAALVTQDLPSIDQVFRRAHPTLVGSSKIENVIEYSTSRPVTWFHVNAVNAAREFAIHVNHTWLGGNRARQDLFVHVRDALEAQAYIIQCTGVAEDPSVRFVRL